MSRGVARGVVRHKFKFLLEVTPALAYCGECLAMGGANRGRGVASRGKGSTQYNVGVSVCCVCRRFK